MSIFCSNYKLAPALFFGAGTVLSSAFTLMYSKSSQTAAAIFGECCTNSTVVTNCKNVVCELLAAKLESNWTVRVVTSIVFPATALAFTVVLATCTCVDSDEVKAEIEGSARETENLLEDN